MSTKKTGKECADDEYYDEEEEKCAKIEKKAFSIPILLIILGIIGFTVIFILYIGAFEIAWLFLALVIGSPTLFIIGIIILLMPPRKYGRMYPRWYVSDPRRTSGHYEDIGRDFRSFGGGSDFGRSFRSFGNR